MIERRRRVHRSDPPEATSWVVVLESEGTIGAVVGGYTSFQAALDDTPRLREVHGEQWDADVSPLDLVATEAAPPRG